MRARRATARQRRRDPLIGTQIAGRYRVDRIHARGGMSIVYAATYEAQQREVAIKVLDEASASDPQAIERFEHEARTASSLSHGHVVGVSDFGRLPNGRPYLVMPMIMGKDLATLIAEHGPIPATRVASLLSGVASALDSMHAQGLVHRDIKSENIMYVRGDDGTESALVLDFGIAAAPSASPATDDDEMSGTPDFMAPEVLNGEPSDHRADIYSLATVAFELLTGRLPFQGKDLGELLKSRASDPPRSLTEASRLSFHPALEVALARGLARNAHERPGSAGAFVRDLSAAATRARSPLTVPPPQKPVATVEKEVRAPRAERVSATLVGLPFKPKAALPATVKVKKPNKPVAAALPAEPVAAPAEPVAAPAEPAAIAAIAAPVEPVAPVREPSIVVDLSLPPLDPHGAETQQATQPLPSPLSLPLPLSSPSPLAHLPSQPQPQPIDSLRPLSEGELETAFAIPRSPLRRFALPAAAVVCVIALVLWSRSGDAPSTVASPTVAPVAPVASVAPVAPVAPVASVAPVAPAAPAAPAAPVIAPPPVASTAVPQPAASIVKNQPVAPPRAMSTRTEKSRPVPRPAASQPSAQPKLSKAAPARAPAAAQPSAQELTQEAVNAMLRGDFVGALGKFDAATQASPRHAPAFRGKGLVLERMDRPKDAANAFRQYLRLAPNAADAEKIRARLTELE